MPFRYVKDAQGRPVMPEVSNGRFWFFCFMQSGFMVLTLCARAWSISLRKTRKRDSGIYSDTGHCPSVTDDTAVVRENIVLQVW